MESTTRSRTGEIGPPRISPSAPLRPDGFVYGPPYNSRRCRLNLIDPARFRRSVSRNRSGLSVVAPQGKADERDDLAMLVSRRVKTIGVAGGGEGGTDTHAVLSSFPRQISSAVIRQRNDAHVAGIRHSLQRSPSAYL